MLLFKKYLGDIHGRFYCDKIILVSWLEASLGPGSPVCSELSKNLGYSRKSLYWKNSVAETHTYLT